VPHGPKGRVDNRMAKFSREVHDGAGIKEAAQGRAEEDLLFAKTLWRSKRRRLSSGEVRFAQGIAGGHQAWGSALDSPTQVSTRSTPSGQFTLTTDLSTLSNSELFLVPCQIRELSYDHRLSITDQRDLLAFARENLFDRNVRRVKMSQEGALREKMFLS